MILQAAQVQLQMSSDVQSIFPTREFQHSSRYAQHITWNMSGCGWHSSVSKTEGTATNPMSINSPGTSSALQTVPCSHLASHHLTVSTSANKDSSTQKECLQAGFPMLFGDLNRWATRLPCHYAIECCFFCPSWFPLTEQTSSAHTSANLARMKA